MIIAMTGKAQAGKNYIGEYIARNMGYSTYAFASPIKQFLNSLFGWDERMSDGILKEQVIYSDMWTYNKFSSCLQSVLPYLTWDQSNEFESLFYDHFKPYTREAMGFFCTKISPRKAMQLLGTEVGRKTKDTLWLDMAPTNNVVITDCRFPNEAEYVKQRGGIIIEVIGDGNTTSEASHASERGVPSSLIDYSLDNSRRDSLIFNKVDMLMENMVEVNYG